ncbi:MAG: BtrH N-terminal domain-containing protein [Bacteroidetes bacterium]|nr:BtrH N-terminal domain-containing protein [Bacteroidota bacterium]
MRKIIESYRNIPGEHCGSVAMKNLLYFYYGVDLPEVVVFGLGAGLDLYVIDGRTPMISGRSASLEQDAAHNLSIPYQEVFDPDNTHAWDAVRAEILKNRPVMLTGDIFHLDYREFKYHFPAHRFVLIGFDDSTREAYIMDRIKNTMEACSYEALAKSRNPGSGFSTFNLWGKFEAGGSTADLAEAVRSSLIMNASRMLGHEQNKSLLMQGLRMQYKLQEGIKGIRSLETCVSSWSQKENFNEIYRFNAINIEKFGNGGGLFRRLYAGFLQWVVDKYPGLIDTSLPVLAIESADTWSSLAIVFDQYAESGPTRELDNEASACLHKIADIEEQLFGSIWNDLGTEDR